MQSRSDLMTMMADELSKQLPGRVAVLDMYDDRYGECVRIVHDHGDQRRAFVLNMRECGRRIFEPAESFAKHGHTGLGALLLLVALTNADDYPRHKIPPLESNDLIIGVAGQKFLREFVADRFAQYESSQGQPAILKGA